MLMVEKTEEMRAPGRPMHSWVDDFRMHLRVIAKSGHDLIVLSQDKEKWRALLKAVVDLRVQ
jgi:hypothetical protein